MKTVCTILIALLLNSFMTSCSKDDEEEVMIAPAKAELFEDTSIMENSPTAEFRITLDKPAPENGYIVLQVTATNDAAFETNPSTNEGEIEIPVIKGRSFVILEFSPQNNALLQDNHSVTFQLKESSDNIAFGTKRSTTIEIADDESPATVSFDFSLPAITALRETDAEGVSIRIELSQPAPGEGSLVLELEGNDNDYFVSTSPALDAEQKIVVPIEAGTTTKNIQVFPKDNNLLENHKTLKLKIISAEGSVTMVGQVNKEILLLDDEIEGKIKSVETVTTDGKRSKKTWEYQTNGKINKILWEKEDGQLFNSAQTYNYSIDGKIQYITSFTGDWESYTWQNGQVVLSEKISGFFKVAYSTYEYNAAGKIRKKIVYALNQGGDSYVPSARYDYEYFADGNLKKESTYIPDNINNWIFYSSNSFDAYTEKINPAPIEIVPTQNVQQYLPIFYAIHGNSVNLSHYYVYEYNMEGMVTKRMSPNETTTYLYY